MQQPTLVWTAETPPRPQSVRGPSYCKHGKDAGQTCYPCDAWTDGPEPTDDELPARCCGCVGSYCCKHGEAPC